MKRESFVSPQGIETYQEDGRWPIQRLYEAYLFLLNFPWWHGQAICQQKEDLAEETLFPILAFWTEKGGKADWLISGIHGRWEKAGPTMIAEQINWIGELGRTRPLVVLPFCNPGGYVLNRYRSCNGESVTDCEHLLGRRKEAACPEAAGITTWVAKLIKDYPPDVVLDLHEDGPDEETGTTHVDSDGVYIYVHAQKGASNVLAQKVVATLQKEGVPLILQGKTRFGEPIINGMVINSPDGSIDEYLAKRGGASSVLVLETPTERMSLEERVEIHFKVAQLVLGRE